MRGFARAAGRRLACFVSGNRLMSEFARAGAFSRRANLPVGVRFWPPSVDEEFQ